MIGAGLSDGFLAADSGCGHGFSMIFHAQSGKHEAGSRKTGDRRRKTEDRRPESDDGCRRTIKSNYTVTQSGSEGSVDMETGSRMSENGRPKSGVGSNNSKSARVSVMICDSRRAI